VCAIVIVPDMSVVPPALPPETPLTIRRTLPLCVVSFVQPVGAAAWKKIAFVEVCHPLSLR
jgi:hypothetical protein